MQRILFILLVLATQVNAQDAYFNWVRKMEFYAPSWNGYYVGTDNAGSVYLTGSFPNTYGIDLDPGTGIDSANCNLIGGIFISKFTPSGSLIWGKSFCAGGIGFSVSSMKVDPYGNTYITGFFAGTIDADPGPNKFLLTASLNYGFFQNDVFIIKLNTHGDFVWAVSFGNIGPDWGHGITVDKMGNVLVTGTYCGPTDFDPGPNTTTLGLLNGSSTSFILKLDSTGGFVWAREIKSNHYSYGMRIATDNLGNVYANGFFDGTIDLDPGPGIALFTTPFDNDQSFFVKLNASGDYVWGSNQIPTGDIVVDANLQIVVYSGRLSKYDSLGNRLWDVKTAGGPGNSIKTSNESSGQLALDRAGNIFFTGVYRNSSDFDPGPNTFILPIHGLDYSDNAFLCRFTPNGEFVWAKGWGGFGGTTSQSLALDTMGNIYSSGFFSNTVDFDPGPNVHTEVVYPTAAGYLLKFGACSKNSYKTLNVNTCNTYTLNGTAYNTSGTYVQSRPNSFGCDSIITLNLTVQNTRTKITASSCGNYIWNGRTINATGIYYDTAKSVAGCDSIIELQLTIRQPVSNTVAATICEGSSLEGYTKTGSFTDIFKAANGCDSVHTINLVVIPRTRTTINRSICAGSVYDGYRNSGVYIDTLRTSTGCDSIRMLNLVVMPTYKDTINRTICEGQNFLGHTTSGTFTDNLKSLSGCDSLVTVHLTVLSRPKPLLPKDTTICLGTSLVLRPIGAGSYTWQDGTISDSFRVNIEGIYTVNSSNACGIGTDAIKVTVSPCTPYFPSAFSPNKDGRNDYFKILQAWLVRDYHLSVFNRSGQILFTTTDPLKGWDGTFKGLQQGNGTYVWQSTYSLQGKFYTQSGTIVLLR